MEIWSLTRYPEGTERPRPTPPEVWECVLPSTGEVISLVRTAVEAHHVARECRVFTIDEVAILIEAVGDGVLDVKQKFPGATIAVPGCARRAASRAKGLPQKTKRPSPGDER